MEYYYYCITCAEHKRNELPGTPISPDQKQWCVKHQTLLPKEVGKDLLICCDFEPSDPRATEWQNIIKAFPKGELWSFTGYLPSRKFINIAQLPFVNPDSGELIR